MIGDANRERAAAEQVGVSDGVRYFGVLETG